MQSECLNSYYKDNETQPNLFSTGNTEAFFEDFMNGIFYVPLPGNINALMDTTLTIFINNHSRELENFKHKELEKLVNFFLFKISLN